MALTVIKIFLELWLVYCGSLEEQSIPLFQETEVHWFQCLIFLVQLGNAFAVYLIKDTATAFLVTTFNRKFLTLLRFIYLYKKIFILFLVVHIFIKSTVISTKLSQICLNTVICAISYYLFIFSTTIFHKTNFTQ